MDDLKHTPGPWSVPHFAEPDVGCNCGYVLTDHLMGAVCTVHCSSAEGGRVETGDNPLFEQSCANARLIAAAPDLLEALEATTGICAFVLTLNAADQDAAQLIMAAVEAAEAAIAKATGAEQ